MSDAAMFQAQVMDQLKELDYDAMFDKYEDRFIQYLYDNFPIGNGTMLINQMEDTDNFEDFVDDRLTEQELIYMENK
jgi:hypothetical protein